MTPYKMLLDVSIYIAKEKIQIRYNKDLILNRLTIDWNAFYL
jgi:hypothetical protein